MTVEEALVDLLAQLDRQDFDELSENAGKRVVEMIDQAEPGSLTPDEHQRVKRLHSLAMALLETRRVELAKQIKRTSEARQILRSPSRMPQAQGGDCDIEG